VVACTGVGYKDKVMEIENATFGSITIDGKTYEHDVLIRRPRFRRRYRT
jgi:hypothetical protein